MFNVGNDLEEIADRISKMSIDDSKIVDQEINQEKVDWYVSRFKQAVDDECREAITAYLQKLYRDDVNDITRIVIMHEALNL